MLRKAIDRLLGSNARLGSTAKCSVFLKQVQLDDAALSLDDLVCLESNTTYSDGEIKINNRIQTRPEVGQLTYHTVITVESPNQQTARLVEYPSGKSSIFLQGSDSDTCKDLTDANPAKKCEVINDFFKNNNLAASIFCNKTNGHSIEEGLVTEGHKVITRTNKI